MLDRLTTTGVSTPAPTTRCSTTRAPASRLDRQRRAARNEGGRPRPPDRRIGRLPARCSGQPAHVNHETRVRQGRRRGLHDRLRGARVPVRPRPRAGPVAPQPRRAVSERRQRRAQHGDSLHRLAVLRDGVRRSRFLRPTCCRSGPTGQARRSDCIRGSPGFARSSTPAASRSSSAPATRTRAVRTSRARTSGPRRSIVSAGNGLARALSRSRCRRRSIR